MLKLHHVLGTVEPKKGKYGVEVEVESSSFSPSDEPIPPGWKLTEDGSLRNNYNGEYVFTQPKTFTGSVNSLNVLQDAVSGMVEPSIRTGVHVHLNATGYTVEDLVKVILVYLSMERALTKYCGENREGNLFCLRACDCPLLVSTIRQAMSDGRWTSAFGVEQYKYSALNLSTLGNHGSLEFRALRTPENISEISEWLAIIEALESYALGLEAPVQIPYDISYHGPDMWVRKVLGDVLFNKVNYPNLEKDVKADMRNVQVLYHTKVAELQNGW